MNEIKKPEKKELNKKGKKVIYLSWNNYEDCFNIWGTRKDALRGMRGVIDDFYDILSEKRRLTVSGTSVICMGNHIGFIPSKTKVTKITFT